MASPWSNSSLHSPLFPFLLFLILLPAASAAGGEEVKTTHLHFYFHETRTGPNATTFTVAGLHNNSTRFGNIGPLDNALTEGPEADSKPVGRAQGFFAFVSMEKPEVMTAVDFVFTEGKFSGSSLSMLGRADASPVVERPIIGGSGRFRMARGYAISRILEASPERILSEFDLYVIQDK